MSPGVEVLTKGKATETLNRQTGELTEMEERLDAELDRFFRRYEELTERHLENRTTWQRRFNPPVAAAYGAWKQHGQRDHRLELAQLAEAPLPEEPS